MRRRCDMYYIPHYDIAALFIEVLLLALYIIRRNYPTAANKAYLLMISVSMVSSLADMISVFTLRYYSEVPVWLNYVINTIYMSSYSGMAITYLFYILVVTRNGNVSRKHKGLCLGIFAVESLFIYTTPWTRLVLYFDENGNYCHGPAFYLLYVISIGTILGITVVAVKNRRVLSKQQNLSIYFISIASIISALVQLFHPEFLISNFVISVFLALLYVSLQNPDDFIDKHSECYNTDAFSKSIEMMINKKQRFSVISFMSEDFIYINQVLGAKVGDLLIATIGDHVKRRYGFRNVYHLSACRFAVIADDNKCGDIVKDIKELFSRPFNAGNVEVTLSVFSCIVSYPGFIKSPDDVMDAITYSFHEMSRNREKSVMFASAESLRSRRRESELMHILKKAIRDDGFDVYYQPIYSVKDKACTTAEALIRLKNTELGFVGPDEFIPLAERNGMITEIGEIVLRKVCEFISTGIPRAMGIKYFEVNLSTVQCVQDNLAVKMLSIMEEYDVIPRCFNFEITETAGSVNDDTLRRNMKRLLDSGATFSMDDYGTGFSTATYLISLPLRIVKIDKSILWSAMENEEAFTILRNTVQMLKELNKKIVVEGVENEEMVRILEEMGCDFMQGYHFSKPVPQEQFVQYLENAAKAAP